MFLACLGLYGVMACNAARRTHEIGIRLALGATRAEVLGMVLRESLVMILAGIGIGIPAALAATRLLSARLFGVSAADPVSILVAVVAIASFGALAGFLPAHRASRVDPVVALRVE
jgi:ABC-type antimicrobial peptide transport system permease subunit